MVVSCVRRQVSSVCCTVLNADVQCNVGVGRGSLLHQCRCACFVGRTGTHHDEVDAGADDEDHGDSAEVDADGGAHMC